MSPATSKTIAAAADQARPDSSKYLSSTISVGRTLQLSYQVKAPGAYEDYFGIGIYSTYPGNKYEFLPGTSMAAHHFAGVVALMFSANKTLTDAQVRQIVTTTAGNSLA
ncbi:S8 family serine peptidase [Nostoc sp. NZL]|uniref:S8 family serine peptidase n=1 Tax=Nostoc sp. NZL TaxID=2650612 RepID=UPI0018C77080|nr:S8 family serine peptidase [Nostoc sp. NZL]